MIAPGSGRPIAVLGGSGFLGSHIADALSEAGHAVRVFDVAASPYLQPTQEMIVGDILDPKALRDAVDGCQAVYHFAAIADIEGASADPLRSATVNVLGTVQALVAARDAKVERFLFSSTVYVNSRHGAFYRASKQSAEQYIETYAEQFGLPYTILRYGTLYGPRSDDRNRVHKMLREALHSGRIDYPGSPRALRQLIHVKDAATLSLEALDPRFANTHLILTGQEKMRIAELVDMIKEIMPHPVEAEFRNAEPEGHYELTPYSYVPDRARTLVPQSFIDMGQGLLDCLQHLAHEDSLAGDEVD